MVEINTIKGETYQVIAVLGEVDASSSIELDNAMKQASDETSRILVDLTNLEYISSAGLGVFISYLEELKGKHIKLILFGMSEKVFEVFQILGLQNLMTIVNTKEEGISLLDEA